MGSYMAPAFSTESPAPVLSVRREPCIRRCFIPDGDNPLKAALFKHHVKQFNEASCSVASVVTVVNALREFQGHRSNPITQVDILEKVRTGYWKERMSPGGHNGKRGLPLPLLGEIVKSSLDAYSLAYKTVETVHGAKDRLRAQEKEEELKDRLVDFENSAKCLIIAHFDQGAFVRTPNIPHISPVGQFNTQTGDVTILDVDPEQDSVYKVPFDTFCKGVFSSYQSCPATVRIPDGRVCLCKTLIPRGGQADSANDGHSRIDLKGAVDDGHI